MIRLRQVKIPISEDNLLYHQKKIAKLLKTDVKNIEEIIIQKKSLDARQEVVYIYEFDVKLKNEKNILKHLHNPDIFLAPKEKYIYPTPGTKTLRGQIIIVGAGPAGLFAAYLLAHLGYKPLVIEQGKSLEERCQDVNLFWQTNQLNETSNVQFGEGGAGTFSDGKLNTLKKDPNFLQKKVMEIFVECGAPAEIKYLQKPHIGTDKLRIVIKNLRQKIIAMGGKFLFETKLTNLIITDNVLTGIEINQKETIPCGHLILAIGHSARDTFRLLYEKNIVMEAKPFAMGIRVMHDQKLINEAQYGKYASLLPPASYKLTYKAKNNRGVYTFCMCPGGYVVNASSVKNHLAINGMSNYKRDSKQANSAIVVTITPNDFGANPLDGISFQEKLEAKAYQVGKGYIPIQTYQDFLLKEKSQKLNFEPLTKGNYTLANLHEILPDFMIEAITEAMPEFAKKIQGFANPDTLFAAIETRTSSPVRILRDLNYEANIKGIYPCGEGAGYAGGITTSAMDGIKVAEAIIKEYHN